MVALVARDERADEARAAVLGAVVAEPDVPQPEERAVLVEDRAVVVRAAHDHLRVAWIARPRRLVPPPAAPRARGQDVVGVRVARHHRVVTDVAGRYGRVVVGQSNVGRNRLAAGYDDDTYQGKRKKRQEPPQCRHSTPSSPLGSGGCY